MGQIPVNSCGNTASQQRHDFGYRSRNVALWCLGETSRQPNEQYGHPMAKAAASDHLITVLRDTILTLVRRDSRDLSSRQLGVLLTCYTEDKPQTIRGLAADLKVAKPAVTRAVDRLAEFEFVVRKPDPADRRSVLIARTTKGTAFVRDLRGVMAKVSASA